MKYRSVLAFLVLCTAAQAGEVEEEQTSVAISAKRAAECEAGGGCAYVTQAELRDMLVKIGGNAYEAGKAHERERCGSRTGYGL